MSRKSIWRFVGASVAFLAAVFVYWFLHASGRSRERAYTVTKPQEAQPVVPTQVTDQAELEPQLPKDGVGPLFHRRYYVDIQSANRSPEEVMQEVQRNLNEFSPSLYASFEKTQGTADAMRQGDEYHIRMSGPWNGSVCVADAGPLSFSFVTLDGHPEAGIIRFRFVPHPTDPNLIRFEIASWARSRDEVVDWTYTGLKVAQRVQTNMWVEFCERVAKASGGTPAGDIAVITEEQPAAQATDQPGKPDLKEATENAGEGAAPHAV